MEEHTWPEEGTAKGLDGWSLGKARMIRAGKMPDHTKLGPLCEHGTLLGSYGKPLGICFYKVEA